jgi:hypothetical protein
VVLHDWKKIRSLWKGVNAEYKAAFTRFTLSGSHDSNFYNFCQGKKELYYLRLHLNERPGLTLMVEAGLPPSCNLSSGTSKEDRDIAIATGNNVTTPMSTNKTPKKRTSAETLAEVLSATANNGQVLNDRKIEYMNTEIDRKERDSDCKERDLQMRLKESQIRMEESLIRIDETKVRIGDIRYGELTKLRRDLKLLQQELATAITGGNAEEIEELQNDIATLKARKKQCSMFLGDVM